MEKFRNYLLRAKCEIIMDHHALQWLRKMRLGAAVEYLWAAILEEFDFTISHRPGKAQGHVDGLSRLPLPPRVAIVQSKEEEVKEIIRKLHQATHAGATATYQLLRQHYPGVGTRKWCQQVVAECQGCQFGKDYKLSLIHI